MPVSTVHCLVSNYSSSILLPVLWFCPVFSVLLFNWAIHNTTIGNMHCFAQCTWLNIKSECVLHIYEKIWKKNMSSIDMTPFSSNDCGCVATDRRTCWGWTDGWTHSCHTFYHQFSSVRVCGDLKEDFSRKNIDNTVWSFQLLILCQEHFVGNEQYFVRWPTGCKCSTQEGISSTWLV